MHILFTRFPLESAHGGAEIQTLTLMQRLQKKGHKVSFLGSCPVLLQEAQKIGVTCHALEIGKPPVTKWSAMSFLWRKHTIQKRLTDALGEIGQVDSVCMLSLSEKIVLTPIIAATDTGQCQRRADKRICAPADNPKILWIEHDRVGRWLRSNPWLPSLRRLSKTVTTVCVSELSRQIYIDLGWPEDAVIAIPNGIDDKRFTLFPNAPHPKLHPHIGTVSRLSSEKGLDVLIRSMQSIPSVHLTIVGTGPERESLIRLIDTLRLGARVDIVDRVENLSNFYSSLDVFVLPSRDNDPFGLVAAEAMLFGVPTIVTNQCGIAGYLEDGEDSLLCRADDVASLQSSISKLLENEGLRLGISKKASIQAKEKFSIERMVEEYVDALQG